MPGNSSWMPYAPQGVKEFDDDKPFTAVVNSIIIITAPCNLVGGSQIYCLHLKEESGIFI